MNCPACSAENPESAKFCNECGVSLTSGEGEKEEPVDRFIARRGASRGDRAAPTPNRAGHAAPPLPRLPEALPAPVSRVPAAADMGVAPTWEKGTFCFSARFARRS